MPTFWDKLQAHVGAWLDGTTLGTLEERDAALEAQLREQNKLDLPRLGPEWFAETEENLERDLPPAEFAGYIEGGFEEGWLEGQQNVEDFGAGIGTVAGDVAGSGLNATGAAVGNTLKGAGKGLLSGLAKIPWWVWPVVIVIVFLYFGGATFIRAFFKRKAAA